MLEGTNVAVGVTGSIAAVRVVELVHELRRRGASVRGVMSADAAGIIHPWAVEFATEAPVVTEITGAVEHIELCGSDGWADVLLIAPATANTVGKLAAAVDDTPVTTTAQTAIGAGVPVVIAPAMHAPMYDHPGTTEALATLRGWDIDLVDPVLAEGKAKIATTEAIVTAVARAAGDQPLAGERVVVTAGATREPIDPIRVLTNRASGTTGRTVAQAAAVAGAQVTVIHDGGPLPYADVRSVETAAEMTEAAVDVVDDADLFIAAAAVGDYTTEAAASKIKSGSPLTVEFEPTDKVVDAVRVAAPILDMVCFKAEVDDEQTLLAEAEALRERTESLFVVANEATVMGAASTTVHLVGSGPDAPISGEKSAVAAAIIDAVVTARSEDDE